MDRFRYILIAILVLVVSGCSTGPSRPFISKTKGLQMVSSTSDLDTAYVKDHGSNERICAERLGDVAEGRSSGVGFGFGSESVKEDSGSTAVALGGRNPAVLITRELMYRACELSINLNLTKEETLKVYYKFLDATLEVSKTQTGNGNQVVTSGTTGSTSLSSSSSSSSSSSGDNW